VPEARTAFVFPAFSSDLSPGQVSGVLGLDKWLAHYHAAAASQEGVTGYNSGQGPDTGEYSRQCKTYVLSCAASAALRELGIIPDIAAGYSMGIYAAIQDAGCITFEAGLQLISAAYRSLENLSNERKYSMMVIIGLSRRDIDTLISRHRLSVRITNQNSGHAFVISGTSEDLVSLRNLAAQEGALHIRTMETSIPYHSEFLKANALKFEKAVSETEICMPRIPVISLVDQSLLADRQAICHELVRNLHHHLNWQKTLETMLSRGITRLIECGPPTGLARNSKFIPGNFSFFTLEGAAAV
jgi:[acyl-carrier-protein] S-malonyltransferase